MIPPAVTESFSWIETDAGAALTCLPLQQVARHLFTTRSWPLGSVAAAPRPAAWEDVARALDLEIHRLFRVRQVHGTGIAVVRAGEPIVDGSGMDADIIVTDDPTVGLAVRTADCVPLLMADTRTSAVAAAHAGWRGLALRVPEVTIGALSREFGSRPTDLIAAIGPSIGACCYEVGAEVRSQFQAAGFSAADLLRWFAAEPSESPANRSILGSSYRPRSGRWFFDVRTATRDQLVAQGVPAPRVHDVGLCTASHAEAFCSYRRDGIGAGRLAAAIRRRVV